MRKRLKIISILLVLSLVLPCGVFAAEDVREPVKLTVDTTTGLIGETVTVDINLSDNRGFCGMGFDVYYDDAYLSLSSVETYIGSDICTNSGVGFYDDKIRFQYAGLENVTGNGALVSLTFETSEFSPELFTEIEIVPLRNSFYCYGGEDNREEYELDVQCVDGGVNLFYVVPGDINGDGAVTNRDAARILQLLAGWNVSVVEDALDVNGDGVVNNRDAARILQYLVGWDVELCVMERLSRYADCRIVSNSDVGQNDEGDWQHYYELYNPFTGVKEYEVPGKLTSNKASSLGDSFESGSLVRLVDGFVDDKSKADDGSFKNKLTDVMSESLVWISDYSEDDGVISLVPAESSEGVEAPVSNGCKDCFNDAIVSFEGAYKDIEGRIVGEENGIIDHNSVSVDENTVVTVIKGDKDTMFYWGNMSLADMSVLADPTEEYLCYNSNNTDRNGNFRTGYADYLKGYVALDCNVPAGELPVAEFIILVVHDNEQAAMDTYNCTTCDFKEHFSVTPSNNALNVALDSKITVNFDYEFLANNGESFTAEYVNDNFELRRSSVTGEKVSFTVVCSDNGKNIVLTPDEEFDSFTKYCLIIPENTYVFEDGACNNRVVSFFRTSDEYGEEDDDESEGLIRSTTPKNGATKVIIYRKIEISFNSTIYCDEGVVDEDFLVENEVLSIHKGSLTGPEVAFELECGSKHITLIPEDELDIATKYFVTVKGGIIGDILGNLLEEYTFSFTTEGSMEPVITPEDGDRNVPIDINVTLQFPQKICEDEDGTALSVDYLTNGDGASDTTDDIVILREGGYWGEIVLCEVYVEQENTIVLNPCFPLEKNTKYYLYVKPEAIFNEAGDDYCEEISQTFTTVEHLNAKFTPKDGAKNVPVDSSVTVTFSEPVFDAFGNEFTNDAFTDLVHLYEGEDEGGEPVEFLTSYTEDRKLLVVPVSALKEATFYTLVLDGDFVFSIDGEALGAQAITFKTDYNIDKSIEVFPDDDDVDVAVTPTITFASPIFDENGEPVTNRHAREYIYLSTSSTKSGAIDCDVEVNEDCTEFTIYPYEYLDFERRYYIIIDPVRFFFENGDSVKTSDDYEKYWRFSITEPYIEIADVSASAGEAVIDFYSSCAGQLQIKVRNTSTAEIVVLDTCDIDIGDNTLVLESQKLEAGNNYEVNFSLFADGSSHTYVDSYRFSIEAIDPEEPAEPDVPEEPAEPDVPDEPEPMPEPDPMPEPETGDNEFILDGSVVFN